MQVHPLSGIIVLKQLSAKKNQSTALYEVLRAVGMGLKVPPPGKGDLDVKTFVVEVVK